MNDVHYLRPRTVRVERAPIDWRATWRDWAVTLGFVALNLAILILVVLGACDVVAWVLA